jgi:hypothetical protein
LWHRRVGEPEGIRIHVAAIGRRAAAGQGLHDPHDGTGRESAASPAGDIDDFTSPTQRDRFWGTREQYGGPSHTQSPPKLRLPASPNPSTKRCAPVCPFLQNRVNPRLAPQEKSATHISRETRELPTLHHGPHLNKNCVLTPWQHQAGSIRTHAWYTSPTREPPGRLRPLNRLV